MSWLMNPRGDPPAAAATTDEEPKVADPSIPGRMVSAKKANQPFLAYKQYKNKQEADHNAWVERMKERDEKIARGEKVGPAERDPTEEVEIGLGGVLKFLLMLVIFVVLAGKFFTGSFLWEYDGKWVQLKTYIPHDGSDPHKPLYLAIDHDVYDVSANRRTYGPGGSYHHMAGVDAARSFATGCFATHRTHDIRGLNEREMQGLNHWKEFFANHKSYTLVGKVVHPPIDPSSPIPEHCNPLKREPQEEAVKPNTATQPTGASDHQEL
ncbi:hypothetical protein HWV62_921 [Athelia sp. TMB]|nr:hypothetical protein HWV62_921 [Athelia sp. TMB]